MGSLGFQVSKVSKGIAPRLYRLPCRHLSSASRRIPPRRPALHLVQWQTSRNISIPTWLGGTGSNTHSALREGSPALTHAPPAAAPPPASANPPLTHHPISETATSAAPPYTPPTPTPADAASHLPNLDTITLDSVDLTLTLDLASLPENIGYLKQIGLHYGLGPTSLIESVLEHFHIWAGLPWWGAIAATALVFRLVTFPFYLKAADANARQQALVSVTSPIQKRLAEARAKRDNEGMMQAWREMKAVRSRAGLKYSHQFVPAILQGVLGYCGFKLMRDAAVLPVPGFHDGGFLWLSDLTLPDGYLIMPAIMAGSIHMLVRWGGETGSNVTELAGPGLRMLMLYGMPGMIFLFTGWQSGALCVWFAASGALGMGQALLLRKPAVREALGIAPLYLPSKSEGTVKSPMAMLMENMQPRGSSKALDVKGISRPTAETGGGKNVKYMKPSYQSPNLQTTRNNSNRTSRAPGNDVTLPSELNQPRPGIVKGITAALKAVRENYESRKANMRSYIQDRAEKQKRDAIKRRAEEYEKRARSRGR